MFLPLVLVSTHMANETERTAVNVDLDTHEQFSKTAGLLGVPIKDAVKEALTEWTKRNSAAAKKKAHQLFESAA